jgi:hypothetical protein
LNCQIFQGKNKELYDNNCQSFQDQTKNTYLMALKLRSGFIWRYNIPCLLFDLGELGAYLMFFSQTFNG